MQGVATGTPGTVPTNWVVTTTGGVITREVVSSGTEDGIDYVDIRYQFSGVGESFIWFDGTASITASSGQAWSAATFIKLVSGSFTNLTVKHRIREGTAAGGFIWNTEDTITPTTSALRGQRYTKTLSSANASTERVVSGVVITATGAGDITLRIGLPQLEQGAFATSVIRTTSAAVTRNADVATVNSLTGWFNASEGTVVCEWLQGQDISSAVIYQFDDGPAGTSLIRLRYNSAGTNNDCAVINLTANQATLSATTQLTTNTEYRNAMAYKSNDFARSADGGAIISDTSGSVPSVTRLLIGAERGGTEQPNCHIKHLAYFPRRLTNTELVQYTT
jgi:hypothetical protein